MSEYLTAYPVAGGQPSGNQPSGVGEFQPAAQARCNTSNLAPNPKRCRLRSRSTDAEEARPAAVTRCEREEVCHSATPPCFEQAPVRFNRAVMLLIAVSALLLGSSGAVAAQAPPAGATAKCGDGTYSKTKTKQGACSKHKGITEWYGARENAAATPAPATPAGAAPSAAPTHGAGSEHVWPRWC